MGKELRSAEATRERILAAATSEFAAFGIAGARIDRIAKNASANKNLIYVYFGSKERLFISVLERHLKDIYDTVPFTPEDLPSYAVALFDFSMDHPALLRLLTWFGLEQQNEWPLESSATFDVKLKAIARAQRNGTVGKDFTPAFLLTFVVALSSSWTAVNPFGTSIDPDTTKHRSSIRRAVGKAVERLCRKDIGF